MFPIDRIRVKLLRMSRQLTEHRIRTTCRDLIANHGRVSGRALRRELRVRFGAVGKTARVFQIWREESVAKPPAPEIPVHMAKVQQRLQVAEAAMVENQARAERAEFREQAHQEHWAMEIDRLREQLRTQPPYAKQIRALQEQVLQLTAELQAARADKPSRTLLVPRSGGARVSIGDPPDLVVRGGLHVTPLDSRAPLIRRILNSPCTIAANAIQNSCHTSDKYLDRTSGTGQHERAGQQSVESDSHGSHRPLFHDGVWHGTDRRDRRHAVAVADCGSVFRFRAALDDGQPRSVVAEGLSARDAPVARGNLVRTAIA